MDTAIKMLSISFGWTLRFIGCALGFMLLGVALGIISGNGPEFLVLFGRWIAGSLTVVAGLALVYASMASRRH